MKLFVIALTGQDFLISLFFCICDKIPSRATIKIKAKALSFKGYEG